MSNTERYYHVLMHDDDSTIISIRADEMNHDSRMTEYEFKIDDRTVGKVVRPIRAWWIEDKAAVFRG